MAEFSGVICETKGRIADRAKWMIWGVGRGRDDRNGVSREGDDSWDVLEERG